MTRKRGTGTQPPPLTPEERRELVERPFPTIRVVGASRSWGGTSTVNWFKDNTSRAYTHKPFAGDIYEWLKTVSVNDI